MTALRSTEESIAMGRAVRGDATRIERLRALDVAASARGEQCLAARDVEGALRHAFESQFYREAVEAATMTGGIGDWLRREEATA